MESGKISNDVKISREVLDKVESLAREYESLLSDLSGSGIPSREYQQKAVRVAEIEDAVKLGREWSSLCEKIKGLKEIIVQEDELAELAEEDISSLLEDKARVKKALEEYFYPESTEDKKNAIVEIRAGVGGDEAALFAGSMFRMYSRYCEKAGYKLDVLDSQVSEAGGFKEISFLIKGRGAFGDFRHESGVHRVQRVPDTESHGRIHTSAATVAVLKEAEDKAFKVDPRDLRIETYRASGAGGQHVNKADSAVRITHIPTNFVVTCQAERSQLQNRAKAMKLLKARLSDFYATREKNRQDEDRKEQVRGGERSEKIRTYNFPQNRLTDHRIELTLHNLSRVMEGELSELIERLKDGLK